MFSESPTLPPGIVLDLQYLPSLEYFTALVKYERVHVEANEHFQKQTWRNRCQILTVQGIDTLIVPVQEGRSKVLIREARIDYRQPWVNRHWRAIQSAYGKAPFFEHYGEAIERVYQKRPAFLFDLNWELLTICLNSLRWKKIITFTEGYEATPGQGFTEGRGVIHPKQPFAQRPFYQSVFYPQVFGEQFFPNLSILDLLFNQGPESKSILRQSVAS
ncbi:MAG: WbqC family protein [Cytophagaceae bacterium]|nr:WbqC family protein [Cytophagaceae bacterium]